MSVTYPEICEFFADGAVGKRLHAALDAVEFSDQLVPSFRVISLFAFFADVDRARGTRSHPQLRVDGGKQDGRGAQEWVGPHGVQRQGLEQQDARGD